MGDTAVTPKCPKCGATLPGDAPEGLCPRCLLTLNLSPATVAGNESAASTSKPPPPTPEALAPHFPQLEIVECLGRGGMGAVYKARQSRIDRLVALKILSPERQGDSKFTERFEREARALARLNHPNIVTVHDFGEAGGFCYLLMEFVDGASLRDLLRQGKLSATEALAIVPKICDALQYAHNKGIVHRDIKPENILLAADGQVKIADFGIAKLLEKGERENALTGVREVVGTPHYMAPEQAEKPETVDHRADIYSLGVVFYEMLTGELPLGKFAPPSRKAEVDVRLDEVVLRTLEKEPELRYQRASQVKTDLETCTSGMSVKGSHEKRTHASVTGRFPQSVLWMSASFIVLAIVGLTWWLVTQSKPGGKPVGCVAWWRAESNALDSVGTNHGVEIGNVAYAPGSTGQGFHLDGAGSYIRVPTSPSLCFAKEFTIELWCKSEQKSTAYDVVGLVAKRNPVFGPLNYEISLAPNRRIDVFYNDPAVVDTDDIGSAYELSRYDSAPSSGEFHHLAATFQQSSPNAVEIRTFVDGQLVRTRVLAGSLSRAVNDAPVTIGTSVEFSSDENLKGIIDEIAIYNRALGADEITTIYRETSKGNGLTQQSVIAATKSNDDLWPLIRKTAGCIAWWRAEENTLDSVSQISAIAEAISYRPGAAGWAFDFDGYTSAVTVPASSTLAVRSMTIAAWVNPAAVNLPRPILEFAAPDQRAKVQLWYGMIAGPGGATTASGGLYALLRGANHDTLQAGSEPGVLVRDQWTHVAMTFDYESHTLALYANGVTVAASRAPTPLEMTTIAPVCIGYRPASSAELFANRRHDGALDEIMIFNRALSVDEIITIYRATAPKDAKPAPKTAPETSPAKPTDLRRMASAVTNP